MGMKAVSVEKIYFATIKGFDKIKSPLDNLDI